MVKTIELSGNAEKEKILNSEKSWLSCREAAILLGFSQRHIINLIRKGKINAQKDENGNYDIQKSDFFKTYPKAMNKEGDRTDENNQGSESTKLLEEQIQHLQEMIKEKSNQNEFLTEQLMNFTLEKSKMLDAINNHARLLEYKETGARSAELNSDKKESIRWWPFAKR